MDSRIGTRWTTEEIEKLKILIEKGSKPQDIADKLGRCDKGVKSKAYSLKLKFGSR